MSSPGGTFSVFPFLPNGGAYAAAWESWDTATADTLVLTFPSSASIASIWLPYAPVAIALTLSGATQPFYTTDGSGGSELIPMPPDAVSVTLQAATQGDTVAVFYSSQPFDPTKVGVQIAALLGLSVTPPLTSTGGQNPTLGLTVPLPVAYGGSGSASPGLIGGANVSVTGPWPNQTVSVASSGVTAVTASAPLTSTGGSAPVIAMTLPLAKAYGGTGKTSALQTKLAIALGFVAGTVTTSADMPAQPLVSYTGATLTGLWLNCKTADTTTVFTVSLNGTPIGTITNMIAQPVYAALPSAVAISSGDILSAAVTTAGTAADCALVAEGVQSAF